MVRRNNSLMRTLLPVLLLFLAIIAVTVWIVHNVAHPPRHSYIVTPDKYVNLSVRGVQVTNETWRNGDGTTAQGWLLRGTKGAPAVVFLHGYGGDRSWMLNLGVKLNEATNFTILWPDLRGHGENPPTKWTSFGSSEVGDLDATFNYLQSLKAPDGQPLVAGGLGLYGVEMGAYTALVGARNRPHLMALALDSVPTDTDDVIAGAVGKYTGMDNAVTRPFVKLGARVYYLGNYHNESSCGVAHAVTVPHVLLLSGATSGRFRSSTQQLAQCFSNPAVVDLKPDLPLTGLDTVSATGEQSEAYDRLVIDFFDKILRPTAVTTAAPAQQPTPKMTPTPNKK